VTESRTLYRIIALLSAAILVNQCSQPRAQEGNMASLARVYDTEQTWRRAAVIVPGPAWGPAVREAVPEAPKARQSGIQKVIDESERCYVAWHSRRGKQSKIVCYARR
jgi:hypothetical protein